MKYEMECSRQGTFKGTHGLELYYQSWHPEGQVRAILVIVHGLGGHSGLYGNIVEHLIPKNYAVYAFDLRGNGRSPGQRGYINAWTEFREDLQAFVQLIKTQYPEQPLFLLGHSVGAVIVLDYVLRCPSEASNFQGVIALAPALGKIGVPPFKLALGRLLSRVWPRFSLSTSIDLSTASSDPAVIAAYAQDPWRHTQGNARFSTEYLATVAWIHEHAADLQVPLLILHGGADQVALPEGGCAFFQRVTILDKERREYPGVYHEIQNDRNYPEMLTDLDNWLERHLPPQNP
jgi:alpha-beta hydrolase superfamily lysophospholipase